LKSHLPPPLAELSAAAAGIVFAIASPLAAMPLLPARGRHALFSPSYIAAAIERR